MNEFVDSHPISMPYYQRCTHFEDNQQLPQPRIQLKHRNSCRLLQKK